MKKSRIDKLLKKFPFVTNQFLYDLYVVQEKSLPDIYKTYGMDYRATRDLLLYFGIPIRSISQSRMTATGKKKIVTNFFIKHGVENPSQLREVKEKKKKTFLSNYGVDNIWKSPKYYAWLNDYMFATYGVKRFCENPWGWKGKGVMRKDSRLKKLWENRTEWWESLTDEEKSKMLSKVIRGNKQTSKLETRFSKALSRLRVSFEPHVIVEGKNFDFKINKSNILVEVNGDFWHANPAKYKSNDVMNFPGGDVRAYAVWNKDRTKIEMATARGHKVLIIWESEMKSMNDKSLDAWILENIVKEA